MTEKRITIRLDDKLYNKLEKQAEKEYRSISSIARQAIAIYLEDKK